MQLLVHSLVVRRYVVMLCGKKAIHEALITKSKDFADRQEFYSLSLVNPDAKGCDSSFIFVDHLEIQQRKPALHWSAL